MSASAPQFAPLPQAPTAQVPSGMNADGAARSAWAPNVFTWVLVWRALITAELVVAVGAGLAGSSAWRVVATATALTLWSALPAARVPHAAWARRSLLTADLAACMGLMIAAPDQSSLALLAAYGCSTVVSWAASQPAAAFLAGGACALTFGWCAVHLGGATSTSAGFTGTVALFFFFALATSGFFTVAHRIGALEIAAEISRERGRYRRDLHDRLGQALSGLHFEVQAVHAVGLDAEAPGRLRSLADGYRDALRMLRDLFRVGDEPMVGTNVASVIRQEARRMGQQAGVRIDVVTTGDASRVPPWMRPHVVAVAGESVNNAVKNGHAAGIDIDIDVTEDLIVLSITDDGGGFDNPPGTITEKEGHYGLREMAERARICGGEVVVASQPGFGTRVRLQVPVPEGSTEDILERDASKLRENVWTLLTALRLMLGSVAAIQLALSAMRDGPQVAELVILTAVVADIVAGTVWSQRVWRAMQGSSHLAEGYIAAMGALTLLALMANVTPAFLLYAPLILLATAIARGRRLATRCTWAFVVSVALVASACELAGTLGDSELEAVLVHVTDIALVGIAAIQGAKLLDRLETLQIRVRYQALARLRHGLSSRMRDQLTERLEELEQRVRALAVGGEADPRVFSAATDQLQRDSTELKRRLRDILHTLAEPSPSTPGRTPAHV